VLLGPNGTRNLAVRDVTKQDVSKRVLALAGHGGTPCALDELLAVESVEPLPCIIAVDSVEREHGSVPEHLAEHRGVLQQNLLLLGKGVETGGDDSVDRLG